MPPHTPARGDSHMGLGANSCGIVASQLGAAPGARESAAWSAEHEGSFIVAAMGGGAARTRLRGSLDPHVRGSLGTTKAYVQMTPGEVAIVAVVQRQTAIGFAPLYAGESHCVRKP